MDELVAQISWVVKDHVITGLQHYYIIWILIVHDSYYIDYR